MSTLFVAYCMLCREEGPVIRCSAGGVSLNGQEDEWDDWLMEHEWHDQALLHEQRTDRPEGFAAP